MSYLDIHRRQTFEIGADPDGAGPLLRPATNYSYDLDGQLTQTDRGNRGPETGVRLIFMNIHRRQNFEIAADPDGVGPLLLCAATNYICDPNGKGIQGEQSP